MIKRWTWLLPSVFLLWWFKTSGKKNVYLADGEVAEGVRLDDDFVLVRWPVKR